MEGFKDEYFVAFEFMFRFVEAVLESCSDDDDLLTVYNKFYQIREDLKNGK